MFFTKLLKPIVLLLKRKETYGLFFTGIGQGAGALFFDNYIINIIIGALLGVIGAYVGEYVGNAILNARVEMPSMPTGKLFRYTIMAIPLLPLGYIAYEGIYYVVDLYLSSGVGEAKGKYAMVKYTTPVFIAVFMIIGVIYYVNACITLIIGPVKEWLESGWFDKEDIYTWLFVIAFLGFMAFVGLDLVWKLWYAIYDWIGEPSPEMAKRFPNAYPKIVRGEWSANIFAKLFYAGITTGMVLDFFSDISVEGEYIPHD